MGKDHFKYWAVFSHSSIGEGTEETHGALEVKQISEENISKVKPQGKDHKFLCDIHSYDSNTGYCLHMLMKAVDEINYFVLDDRKDQETLSNRRFVRQLRLLLKMDST